MRSTIRRKPVTRRRAPMPRKSRRVVIEPIPTHPLGRLPVTDLELELEKLAGPEFTPDFVR
ncbi:MAG: hypothetical protein HY735_33625 [Verrucomicrobia bacterium]|nr:hypothetical protein [Verrucomicrobiota bacterium]